MIEQIDLVWGQRTQTVELRRTNRRVIRVEVKPAGAVVVHAPSGEPLDAVQSRLNRKCPWIFRDWIKSRVGRSSHHRDISYPARPTFCSASHIGCP